MKTSSLMLCLVLLGASVGVQRASACSRPAPGYFVDQPDGALEIALEGVIVLGAQAMFPERDPIVVLHDLEGFEVSGTIERRDARTGAVTTGDQGAEGRELLIWRADAELAPAAQYRMTIEHGIEHDLQSFEIELQVATEPLPAPTDPIIDALQARLQSISRGLRQECEEPQFIGECGPLNCEFVDMETMVTVSFELPSNYRDPLVVYRLVPEGDDVIARRHRLWGGMISGIGTELSVHYPERQDRYCARLEATSLIDGSVRTSEVSCIEDAFVNELRDEPGVAPSGSGCSVTPGTRSAAPLGLLLLGLLAFRRRR